MVIFEKAPSLHLLKLVGETYHSKDSEYQDKLLNLKNCLLCPDKQKEDKCG